MPAKHPPVLRRGAQVALTCPASPPTQEEFVRGTLRLRDLDMNITTGASCFLETGLWAGEEEERVEELIGFLLDRSIEAVFAGRGGVGCLQLLPYLERVPETMPAKWIVGRSDLTALHLALWRERGWVGLSGPMVATDFGQERTVPVVAERMIRLLRDPTPLGVIVTDEPLEVWESGEADGVLIPANLSLLASMVGTPFLPDLRGTILVLEEVDEPPHRIDRMLTQLRLARVLDGLAGLVFGQFTRCTPRKGQGSPEILIQALREHAHRLGVPTLAGFPYGHEALFHPLPVGVRASIGTDPPQLALLEGAAAAEGEIQ